MARVRGNFRSLLKRLPETVSEELRELQNETGKLLLARARARVPSKTGAVSRALSFSVTPKTLRLRMGILGKARNRKLFYARFQEFGWRPSRANRKRKLGPISAPKGSAEFRIARLSRARQRVPAKKFIFNMPREEIYRRYQKLWGKALQRAGSGGTND